MLDELLNNGVLENAEAVGAYLMDRLNELKSKKDIIKEVRGACLICGVEFSEPIGKEITAKLRDNGILVGSVGASTLRIVPPLIVTKDDIDILVNKLEEVL